MKRNLIGLALVAGMAMANSAMAQDYDDRWYLTAGAGIGVFDGDRNADNELYGTIGVGKFITPNVSLDLELALESAARLQLFPRAQLGTDEPLARRPLPLRRC